MTTTQRDAIASPATGLLIFNTTTARHEEYTGASWVAIGGGSFAPTNATYITQTANATLTAEQTLSSLSTGDVQVTTTTGVLTSLKANRAAAVAPAVTDDVNSGYAIGSRWIDTTNDKEYVCTDATAGAALWKETTVGGLATTGEVFLTAAGGWPSTTSGCAVNVKNEYGTNDIDLYSLDFDQSTEEYAQWTVWMPADWNAGTVTFQVAWSAASGAGDVIWGLQGRAYANDDAIDQAWGAAQEVTDTLLATGDVHYSPTSSALTLAGGPAAGEMVQFRLYRKAAAAGDTLTADARFLGAKVYYTKS